MKVQLIQTSLYWEDVSKNLKHFDKIIQSKRASADIIILPEMFTTGFTMNASTLAEKIGGPTTEWLIHQAMTKNACITGSFITTDGHSYYNTLLWVYPDGHYQYYHKRHLFRMAQEHLYYSAGKEKIICEYKNFRFLPLICYDLRFPVWSRNVISSKDEYDVILYVANWPEVRIDAWKKLIYARAIENLSYVIGVNRVGIDGTEKKYNGHSMVVNYKGELIADLEDKDTSIIIELDKQGLLDFRQKFPAYLDADRFEIK